MRIVKLQLFGGVLSALCILLLAGHDARAQEESTNGEPPAPSKKARPWAEGVSQAEQSEAMRLFEHGNALFKERAYVEARRAYESALTHWDHPSIRFNLAECMVRMDLVVEALEQLNKSLQYGPDPLEAQVYERALTNKKLLEGQVATVEVRCDDSGANVTLDGQALFTAPGSASRVVAPGKHQIVVSKADRQTVSKEVLALPGRPVSLKIAALPVGEEFRYERRWSTWKPWVVVGVGVATAAAGGLFALQARSTMDSHDEEIARLCPNGCLADDIPASTRDLKDRAEFQSTLGLSLLVAGGVGLTAGAVLVILNQPRAVPIINREQVAITPYVTGTQAGISAAISF